MRSDWKRVTILTAVIFVLVFMSCGTWRRWFDYPSLSDSDRTELVRLTIEKIIELKEAPFDAILLDSGEVIVTNVKQKMLPQLDNINLKSISFAETYERAKQKGPYMFLVFFLHTRTGNRAHITLAARWAMVEDSPIVSDYSSSIISLTFIKDSDKWKFKGIYYPEIFYKHKDRFYN